MAKVRSMHLSLMRSQMSSAWRLFSVLKECLECLPVQPTSKKPSRSREYGRSDPSSGAVLEMLFLLPLMSTYYLRAVEH